MIDMSQKGIPALVAQLPFLEKPPGCMKNNPDCDCGWKLKRIYTTIQVKSRGSRKWRSKYRPTGWGCLKCGYTEYDNMVQDPIYFSRGKKVVKNQGKQTELLEAAR